MNARVGIAILIIVLVAAAALILRPAPAATAPQNIASTATTPVTKPPELDKATLEAARKASEASTKQANAVQANAAKVAGDAKPVLEGYSFLTVESELILSYAVNFDPVENAASTDKFAAALAKNWKIKELESYKPKKITIEFYSGKDRIKAKRSFDPTGKAI